MITKKIRSFSELVLVLQECETFLGHLVDLGRVLKILVRNSGQHL